MTTRKTQEAGLVEQANVRLTQEEHDILQALVFAREVAGSSEILRPVVADFLHAQRDAEEVRLALRARATSRAKREGKLTDLRAKASGKKGPG